MHKACLREKVWTFPSHLHTISEVARKTQNIFLTLPLLGLFLISPSDAFSVEPLPKPKTVAPQKASLSKNSHEMELELLRESLRRDFGILAEDKTDTHSAVVLRSLLFLLRQGWPSWGSLKSFRFLYAYHGHDTRVSIAAFHPEASAISIGGFSSYGDSLEGISIPLIAALAHELGHAFLLEKISPQELVVIARKSGDWENLPEIPFKNFFDKIFLTKHQGKWKTKPASTYSSTNLHEWFAEAFTADVLQDFGHRGLLGKDWRKQLDFLPKVEGDFPTNYNRSPKGFSNWLQKKKESMSSLARASNF